MNRKLEIRLLNYFLLIALAAAMIGVEFYYEMNRPALLHSIIDFVEQNPAGANIESALTSENPIIALRNKIVTMFAVLITVVAIVMMMFIKNITAPLGKMASVAHRINQGDLTQMVAIESQDEIGEVGIAINELASNLQELAKLTDSTVRNTEGLIKGLGERRELNKQDREALSQAGNDLAFLRRYIGAFEMLQTDIEE